MTTAAEPAPLDSAGRGDAAPDERRVARFGVGVLVYTLLVILFGAVVRITGSGAGCGQHWPTCQGELVHLPKTLETAIELSHRLTSGLSAVLVVVLSFRAFRQFPAGHAARRAAAASAVLMLTESLVGAALVLLRLVGQNTSVARAVVMAIHLVNTSFLAAAIALTAWCAAGRGTSFPSARSPAAFSVVRALAGTLLVSVTGAITALGDTLYPVEIGRPLSARLAADQGAAASFLERGRAVHPLIAFTVAVFVLGSVFRLRSESRKAEVRDAALRVMALLATQVLAGVVNVLLSAPGWMQVVHLGLATLVWLSLVLLLAEVATAPATT